MHDWLLSNSLQFIIHNHHHVWNSVTQTVQQWPDNLLCELRNNARSCSWHNKVAVRLNSEQPGSIIPPSTQSLHLEHMHSFNYYQCFWNGQKMLGGAGTVPPHWPSCLPVQPLSNNYQIIWPPVHEVFMNVAERLNPYLHTFEKYFYHLNIIRRCTWDSIIT